MDALAKVSHDHVETTDAEFAEVCVGADLLVANILMEDYAACVAEASGIPVVMVHSAPLCPTSAYASPLVTTRRLPGMLNRATGKLFEQVWWRGSKDDVNGFRGKLGLDPVRTTTVR